MNCRYIPILSNCDKCDSRGFIIENNDFVNCNLCNGSGVKTTRALRLNDGPMKVTKGINLVKK